MRRLIGLDFRTLTTALLVVQVMNNPDLEAEGKAEHNLGKVEKKIGQIEEVLQK